MIWNRGSISRLDKERRRDDRLRMKKELAILLLLVALCAIVTALNPRFISPANLQNTARLV